MDTLGDPFGNSQGGVPSPHSGGLVGDLDDSGLLDEQSADRTFAENPKLR
jgi:hypothetical protein